MPFVQREIALNNGPPWGFRLYEDPNQGLIVHKIRHFSPAFDSKLKEGDVLVKLNGKSVKGYKHADIVNMVDFSFNTLVLLVGRFESIHNKTVTFIDQRGQYHDPAVTKIQLNLQREPLTKPSSPGLVPVPISKLMKEYDIPPRPEVAIKKKRYANSEFFDTGDIPYPTVEEKMEMARKMADSLTAPVNQLSKGAHIFERQRARIDKYTTEGPSPVEEDIDYDLPIEKIQPPPQNPFPPVGFPGLPDLHQLEYGPPMPPPPPPGAPKTLKEYLEKVKTFPKVQHDSIGPEKCFEIASALHHGQDRGSLIFMRNRQRSHKWEHSNDPSSSNNNITTTSTTNVIITRNNNNNNNSSLNRTSSSTTTTNTIIQSQQSRPKVPSKLGRTTLDYTDPSLAESTNEIQRPAKWRPIKFKVPANA